MMFRHFLAALTGLTLGPSLSAQEIMPQTLPVELEEANPETLEVGELIYRGGLKVEPGEEKIGGISGLEWVDDAVDYGAGALWAVADDGRWLKIVPDEINARLVDLYSIEMGPLRDPKGKKLRGKIDTDAEAITRTTDGGWLVSFERDHRIWRYTDLNGRATAATSDAVRALVADAEPNGGLETLASIQQGLLACGEWAEPERANCIRETADGSVEFALEAPAPIAEHAGAPTDAACLEDACYVLFRSYKSGYGSRAAILELTDEAPRILAIFDAPLTLDNFEGLAVRQQFGKRYLYLASDDNFNNCFESERANCQDTLIMKFEIRTAQAAPPQIADAPEPDAQYETVEVVLETAMGDITIALETERAPITAANFLRYVEEGRFDGTVFYRAMSLDREPKPNGLLQGGTQFDPKRILPGIEHEPTSKTGLSHTNGALSMAMGELGSANGDFSIMLQDQTGLDAKPDSEDPVWKNGYAVFGYVIEGMDVVAAIHASAVDPDKGEGWMKGQMLAEPVKIVKARRAEPESED
ncbi:MAG: peptidylprolyl isomerase [Erythrobacter sp.]